MAQGPICIITSSGMICASSPMTQHFPRPGGPVGSETAERVYRAVDHALKDIVPNARERWIYATVAQLMAQGKVSVRQPFTVTATADDS